MMMNNIAKPGDVHGKGGDQLTALEKENRQLLSRIAELERLVRRDTLTPLYNRRHFIETLDQWIWRAHRYGGDFGLMFIDVDQLKAINDQHGHDAGDKMLITIAKALQNSVRRSDIVARMGGDEFGMLLENINVTALPDKADKISKAISKQWFDYEGHSLKPAISIGFTAIEGGVAAAEHLTRADKSMYEAKQAKQR
ncbi:GGDEF domain-containing protein [Sphingorhabdus arenilitoris]|uniref:GGDEF domain-containing protein n=1 Tax=Sphingorhabdus arenilitoris TaxID=1490041 RepID=A0ABV8RFU7_9SPHN